MRAITKQKPSDRITPIYRRLQINDLYKLETEKFMHQFSDKSLPASLEKYFIRITFIHRHSTQTSKRITFIHRHSTQTSERITFIHRHSTQTSARNDYFVPHFFFTSDLPSSIKLSGIKIWNSIRCKFKICLLKSLFRNRNCV